MKLSLTYVRVAMICAVLYGMLIATIQFGLISSGEHSRVLIYWILMPTIWLVQKMPSGVLEKTPLYFIAGINVLLVFSVIYGAAVAIGRIRKKEA
jgi:hypothetical protein